MHDNSSYKNIKLRETIKHIKKTPIYKNTFKLFRFYLLQLKIMSTLSKTIL